MKAGLDPGRTHVRRRRVGTSTTGAPGLETVFLGSGGRWNDCHCGRAFWRDAGLRCVERARNGSCRHRLLKCLMPCLRSMPGAVRDEFKVIRWDGVKQDFDGWNQDQTLRSSMRHSTVWVYQRLPVRSVRCAKSI